MKVRSVKPQTYTGPCIGSRAVSGSTGPKANKTKGRRLKKIRNFERQGEGKKCKASNIRGSMNRF